MSARWVMVWIWLPMLGAFSMRQKQSYRCPSRSIRKASAAKTVPITHRCIMIQRGLRVRKAAIEPAASVIIVLTLRLTVICVKPRIIDCAKTLPCCGSMNCGSKERYITAILGLSRLVIKPIVNNFFGLSAASVFTSKGD